MPKNNATVNQQKKSPLLFLKMKKVYSCSGQHLLDKDWLVLTDPHCPHFVQLFEILLLVISDLSINFTIEDLNSSLCVRILNQMFSQVKRGAILHFINSLCFQRCFIFFDRLNIFNSCVVFRHFRAQRVFFDDISQRRHASTKLFQRSLPKISRRNFWCKLGKNFHRKFRM